MMYFLWSQVIKQAKRMCHPKCIFTLQLVAARLHDQVTTSKGTFFSVFVGILRSRAATLDGVPISAVKKMNPRWTTRSEGKQVFLCFYLVSSSPPPPPPARSWSAEQEIDLTKAGGVTELHNSQLEIVQFALSTSRYKWTSLWPAHRRQTAC